MSTISYRKKFLITEQIEDFYEFQIETMELLRKKYRVCTSASAGSGKTTIMKYIALSELDFYLEANDYEKNKYKVLILANTRLLLHDIYSSLAKILKEKTQDYVCYLTTDLVKQNKVIYLATTGKYLSCLSKLPNHFSIICIDEVDQTLKINSNDKIAEADLLRIFKLRNLKFDYCLASCSDLNLDKPDIKSFLETNNFEIIHFDVKPINYDAALVYINPSYGESIVSYYLDIITSIYILNENPRDNKIFVFCNNINLVQDLYNEFNDTNKCMVHRKLPPERITEELEKFRDTGTILFTTNIAERGINICNARIVIHAGLPDDYEVYLHRNGRSLRDKKSNIVSKVYLILLESDRSRPNFDERYNNLPISNEF